MDDLDAIVASLSSWMRKTLLMLARKDMVCTCTSIGASLTGRQSAYGRQTSAHEGGRTLRALERRDLAFQILGCCHSACAPNEKIVRWFLTDRGRQAAAQLATSYPANSIHEG